MIMEGKTQTIDEVMAKMQSLIKQKIKEGRILQLKETLHQVKVYRDEYSEGEEQKNWYDKNFYTNKVIEALQTKLKALEK
jgi:hypothetical protein